MSARTLLQECGSSANDAALAILAISRAAWRVWLASPNSWQQWTEVRHGREVPEAGPIALALAGELEPLLSRHPDLHAFLLAELGTLHESFEHCPSHPSEFSALSIGNYLLRGELLPAEVKYYLLRNLRILHNLSFSAATARSIRLMVEAARSLGRQSRLCSYSHERHGLITTLRERLIREFGETSDLVNRHPTAFFEFCSALGFIIPGTDPDTLSFPVSVFHGTLLSNLFGLPTSIHGFDGLFEGGLFLADVPGFVDIKEPKPERLSEVPIGARTVLASGPFGTGKSLLTLQVAVEIARKGGLSWVMAMEQSMEECLYSLESIGISTESPLFRVTEGLRQSFAAFSAETAGRGALVFLTPGPLSYSEFLESIEAKLDWMRNYSLRFLAIDPVNSLTRGHERANLRSKTIKFFRRAKAQHVNVWMTCERSLDDLEDWEFEEKTADTVLRLGVDIHGEYRKRSIEVTKSRLQRERPGKQTLAIRGTGIEIFPSSVAISAESAERPSLLNPASVTLGVTDLDQMLGGSSIHPGDVVCYYGPTGTSKTLAGGVFLEFPETGSKHNSSLLIADQDPEEMSRLVSLARSAIKATRNTQQRPTFLCPIRSGYTDPAQVLDKIRQRMNQANSDGKPIDRVLITNLTRWATSMPLVREDPVFGPALLNLFRHYRATLIIVLNPGGEQDDRSLSHFITDNANVVVQFDRIQFRGESRTIVRVLKSSGMSHKKDAWELIVESDGMRVEPTASLLRLHASGDVTPVKVALYLHSETASHAQYNARLLGAVQVNFSPDARIEEQHRSYDPSAMPMSVSSAVDELQVLQLDEFQIPARSSLNTERLASFSTKRGPELLEGRLERLRERMLREDGATFCVVPFYVNLSLLCYRRSHFTTGFPSSWRTLAKHCDEWEREHEAGLFFACHATRTNSLESYNCFFLEILFSLLDPTTARAAQCDFINLVKEPAAVDAARCFRTLTRRSHGITTSQLSSQGNPSEDTYRKAIVWRHWYNTLNQMLSIMTVEEARDVEVQPLYGDIATAGEWYLAVPAHSAAPDLGLELIRFLTTPERELQRLHLGVGLPTRSSFYTAHKAAGRKNSMSPYFAIDPDMIARLIEKPLRRSDFSCYQQLSESLSATLVRILQLPESEIKSSLQGLLTDAEFVGQHAPCSYPG